MLGCRLANGLASQGTWHPIKLNRFLWLEKCFTQRRQSPPGRRKFQFTFCQIILICLYRHHHASKRRQENPTFTARPIRTMILQQEKAFCCQVSIKYFDLKAIKLCVRPTIQELLFLTPLDMVAEKYQTCKDSGHTKKGKISPSIFSSRHHKTSVNINFYQGSARTPQLFCSNSAMPSAPNSSTATLIPSFLQPDVVVAQDKLIVGFIPLHTMQLLLQSSHAKSLTTKPHNSHHYTFCNCRATLLKEPQQKCDCRQQYSNRLKTSQTMHCDPQIKLQEMQFTIYTYLSFHSHFCITLLHG